MLSVGGCDFPIDPGLRANEAPVLWLPRHNPRLLLLTELAAFLADGPALTAASSVDIRHAPEGDYFNLLTLPPARQALFLRGLPLGPLALVLPLDALFEDRVDAGRRLLRFLIGGLRPKPDGFTAHRRRRLKLILRALDGHLAGEDYRGVAQGLFGRRVPADASWRTHSLRGQTIRLVRDGLALMHGGYLDLLRPDHRRKRGER